MSVQKYNGSGGHILDQYQHKEQKTDSVQSLISSFKRLSLNGALPSHITYDLIPPDIAHWIIPEGMSIVTLAQYAQTCTAIYKAVMDNFPLLFATSKRGRVYKEISFDTLSKKQQAVIQDNDCKCIALAIVRKDPDDCDRVEAWIERIQDTMRKEEAYSEAAVVLAIRNPEKAASWIEKIEDQDTKDDTYCSVVAALAAVNPECIESWIEKIQDTAIKDQAYYFAVQALALQNTEQAANWVEKIVDIKTKRLACNDIALTLVPTDPKQAAKWVEKIDTNDRSYINIELALAAKDLERVESLIEGIADFRTKDLNYQFAVKNIAVTNPKRAESWIERIKNDAIKENTYKEAAVIIASVNPEQAAVWIKKIHSRAKKEEAYIEAAKALAPTNPTQAASWVEEIEDRGTKDSIYCALAVILAPIDPKQTASYMKKIQNIYVRDLSYSNAAIASKNPKQAGAWIMRIKDRALKIETYFTCGALALCTNPKKADIFFGKIKNTEINWLELLKYPCGIFGRISRI